MVDEKQFGSGEVEMEPENSEPESSDPMMSDPFDPTQIQINTKQDTIGNLIERLRHDEIDMNSDFQRHADLWSPVQMSRLIESILIRFPLPAFYFDATDDGKWLVVDGLQRLSSIRKFVVEKSLRLRGLEYLQDLNGASYDELPRQYQRRINESTVTLFLIQPGTPDKVKYSVFRRINTGGLTLRNQEIRNALATQREREFLERLAADENMVGTMGDQSKRMFDQELVLRFIAFYRFDFLTSKKNIAAFLDDAMEHLKRAPAEELEGLGNTFRRTIKYCYEIFGNAAFEKRVDNASGGRRRKNAPLFEAWTVNLAKLDDAEAELLVRKKELLNTKLYDLLRNENSDFFRAISISTQKRDHIQIRHDTIGTIIREVLDA